MVKGLITALLASSTLAACSGTMPQVDPVIAPLEIASAPRVVKANGRTALDESISCIVDQVRGRTQAERDAGYPDHLTIAPWAINDQTGRYIVTEGGAGNVLSQGGNLMMKFALGQFPQDVVTVVERDQTGNISFQDQLGQAKRLSVLGLTRQNKDNPRELAEYPLYRPEPTKDGSGYEWKDRYSPSNIVRASYTIQGAFTSFDINTRSGGARVSVAGYGGESFTTSSVMSGIFYAVDNTTRIVKQTSVSGVVGSANRGILVGALTGDTFLGADIGQRVNTGAHAVQQSIANLAAVEIVASLFLVDDQCLTPVREAKTAYQLLPGSTN